MQTGFGSSVKFKIVHISVRYVRLYCRLYICGFFSVVKYNPALYTVLIVFIENGKGKVSGRSLSLIQGTILTFAWRIGLSRVQIRTSVQYPRELSQSF